MDYGGSHRFPTGRPTDTGFPTGRHMAAFGGLLGDTSVASARQRLGAVAGLDCDVPAFVGLHEEVCDETERGGLVSRVASLASAAATGLPLSSASWSCTTVGGSGGGAGGGGGGGVFSGVGVLGVLGDGGTRALHGVPRPLLGGESESKFHTPSNRSICCGSVPSARRPVIAFARAMLAWAGRASLMPSSDLMSRSLAVSDGDFPALPGLGLAGPSCSFTAAFWSHAGSTFACFPSYPVTSSVRRGGLVRLLAFESPFVVIIMCGPPDRG